jgi:Protein of unknown function (DUF4089)
MSDAPFDADALIDASLPLLRMSLTQDSRGAVKLHLEIAEKLARLVTGFELEDEAEPAPVYSP